MIIFKTVLALRHYLDTAVSQKKTIGFAPTMGALHPGHLSLIQQSRRQCDVSVVSIFVNPTQFNDPKDFEKYPVTIENDCLLLEQQETDILFLPSVSEMYPQGTHTSLHYDLGELENLLEGRYRPGHFQGVCQVVHRLLDIVQPNELFVGQKDYQQCMVLQKLIHLLKIATKLNIAPTLREPDGLAMSSRNVRLSAEQRMKATAIYQELQHIKVLFEIENTSELKHTAVQHLMVAGFSKVDYVEIADAETLQPLTSTDEGKKAVALVAAFMGESKADRQFTAKRVSRCSG